MNKPKYRKSHAKKCEAILKEGGTVAHVCRDLKIVRSTFYEWVKKYPSFRFAFEYGRTCAEAEFAEKVRTFGFSESKFSSPALVALFARNIYKWETGAGKNEAEDRENKLADAVAALADITKGRV